MFEQSSKKWTCKHKNSTIFFKNVYSSLRRIILIKRLSKSNWLKENLFQIIKDAIEKLIKITKIS